MNAMVLIHDQADYDKHTSLHRTIFQNLYLSSRCYFLNYEVLRLCESAYTTTILHLPRKDITGSLSIFFQVKYIKISRIGQIIIKLCNIYIYK
jgi:hypothetical protein